MVESEFQSVFPVAIIRGVGTKMIHGPENQTQKYWITMLSQHDPSNDTELLRLSHEATKLESLYIRSVAG